MALRSAEEQREKRTLGAFVHGAVQAPVVGAQHSAWLHSSCLLCCVDAEASAAAGASGAFMERQQLGGVEGGVGCGQRGWMRCSVGLAHEH